MADNIGKAGVEVHGDIAPFEKDLEKIQALIKKMDDLSIKIHAKLAPRQRTSLQKQLDALKPPFTIKVFAKLAGGQRKSLQDSLNEFKTLPNIKVEPKLVVGSKTKIQKQLDAITGLNVVTQLDLDKAALATETQRQRLLTAQNVERRTAVQLETALENVAKKAANESLKASRIELAQTEKMLKVAAAATAAEKEREDLREKIAADQLAFAKALANSTANSLRTDRLLLELERERGNTMLGLIKRMTDVGIREVVMTRNMASFSGVLGSALGKATQLNNIKFDNLNQLLGSAVSGDTLLNKLGEIFNKALKVRKVAVQMGTALASGFAAGAQAVGALLSGMATAVQLGAALAGIGVIAIAVKFLLDDAEVKASLDNLKSTFRSVITDSAQNLKPLLTGFFDGLSEGLNSQRPAFDKFFKTVEPGFKTLTTAINDFVKSEDFARILGKFGNAANAMLTKVGEGLRGFILGTEKVFDKLVAVQDRLRDALGPGIFEGISADGIVAGIQRMVVAIESAGPGIRAFKENFGTTFDAVKVAVEGVLDTIGKVGPDLFNALGPIAVQVVTSLGQVAESFIRLSSEVLPEVKDSVIEFVSVFGTNFATSIELLAEPLSRVIVGITELGTHLAPLLPLFSEILVNLDPVATAFLGMLDSLSPLVIALGEFAVELSKGVGPVLATVLTAFETIGTVISSVVTPAITLLNNSGLVPLLGGLAAIAGVITAVGVAFAVLAAKARLSGAAFAAAKAQNAALGGGMLGLRNALALTGTAADGVSTKLRIMAGVATTVSGQVAAGGQRINTALGVISSRMPATAAVVANGFRRMSTESLQASARIASANARAATSTNLLVTANTRTVASARLAAVGFRTQAAALTVAAGASRVASVAARGLGAAFRFMLGPIGLIMIGIELLIAGFKGFMRILGGVIEILKAVGKALVLDFDGAKESFKKGMDDIVGGAKDAAGQIKDHFTGGGDELGDGIAEGAESGVARAKNAMKSLTLDAASAGTAAGQSLAQQFASQLSTMDVSATIKVLEDGFRNGGFLMGDQMAEGVLTSAGRLTAALAEQLQIDPQIIENFKSSGDLMGSGLDGALRSKLENLKDIPANLLGDAEQMKALGERIGGPIGTALVSKAEETINAGKPGVHKATKDLIPKTVEEAKVVGKNAANDVVNSMTELLSKSGKKISDTIVGAFQAAAPGVQIRIGQEVNNMIVAAFTNMQTSGLALAATIQNVMTGAFTFALMNMSSLVGQQINTMMVTAFATMQTSGVQIAFSIQNVLTGAFAFAFINLPSAIAPMIGTAISTAFTLGLAGAGLAIAAPVQTVLTGAFTFALINLPSAIAPFVSQALTTGVQLGLNGFGLSIQGVVNAAFITGFSGVGASIQAPLSAAFLGAMGLVKTFATTIKAAMSGAVRDIGVAVKPVETSIANSMRIGMTAAVQAARTGSDNLTQVLRDTILIISNMDFFTPGYKIGQRLADGIRASTPLVAAAADDMAAAVANRVPQSPPKEGPLSGQGDPLKAGARIVERLIAGIRSQQAELETTMNKILGGFQTGQLSFGGRGSALGSLVIGSQLTGSFNKNIGGDILKQDTGATMSSTVTNNRQIQIRPGTVNVSIANANDPRQFLNDLSAELINLTTAR